MSLKCEPGNPFMQLADPHKGWENEHLATFLLSRIAFVAAPITVGDDVGTDIFCTLFEPASHKGKPVLLPRRSIAVQIKSQKQPTDIAPRLDYLARLEVPYYLGIVDQQQLTLELFSARFLPALLSLQRRHSRLLLKPVDVFQRDYRPCDASGVYSLLCHKVAMLSVHDDAATALKAAAAIREDSTAALQAIASRLNHEYVFEIAGGEVEFYAGPDSARTFRHSFYKRLAEAYYNLSWLIDNNLAASDAEMNAFMEIADQLGTASDVPGFVQKLRAGLQERLLKRGNP